MVLGPFLTVALQASTAFKVLSTRLNAVVSPFNGVNF